jgi:hypothetical protein
MLFVSWTQVSTKSPVTSDCWHRKGSSGFAKGRKIFDYVTTIDFFGLLYSRKSVDCLDHLAQVPKKSKLREREREKKKRETHI